MRSSPRTASAAAGRGVRRRLRVPEDAGGERLDRFLAGVAEIGSRGAAERLLDEGGVLVDGAVQAKSYKLAGGEEVSFEPPGPVAATVEPEEMELRIAYEDEHLFVVDKPAGIVVHPAPGHATGTLVHGLVGHAAAGGNEPERPGIVHRLDRDTSGLMVVARSGQAHRSLQSLLRRRDLKREYLALVVGRPRSRTGRIEAPIGRDRTNPLRHSLDTANPRDAVTEFEVEELLSRHALLRVSLETGRTHQIRVHLAAIDLPVAGDPTYGRPAELGLERQFLHATRLTFPHPITEQPVDVTSPLPRDLAAALDQAREAAI